MRGCGTYPAFEDRRAALLIPDTGADMHTMLICQTQAQLSEAAFDIGIFTTRAFFCEKRRILTALRENPPRLADRAL